MLAGRLTGMFRKSVKSVLLFLQHDQPYDRIATTTNEYNYENADLVPSLHHGTLVSLGGKRKHLNKVSIK